MVIFKHKIIISLLNLVLAIIFLFQTTFCIKFSFIINPHSSQCFHQNIQIQTRYQILAKANTTKFYLTVSQGQKFMHQDRRTSQQDPFKFYSAFSQINGQVYFCIGSSQLHPIQIELQFYHGLHLQDSIQQMAELTDIGSRLVSLEQFIQRNYGMYQSSLQAHKEKSYNFGYYLIIALIIIVFGTAAAQIYVFIKTRKYLIYKKIL